MKKRNHLRLLSLCLLLVVLLGACAPTPADGQSEPNPPASDDPIQDPSKDDDHASSITPDQYPTQQQLYEHYFEQDVQAIDVACTVGTPDCYTLEGSTLIFSGITADSIYTISGQFRGNIVIDVDEDCRFELELRGFSLVCDTTSPITVLGGDKVTLTAKKGFVNAVYDCREALEENSTQYSAAIYALTDLDIGGKGALTVVSQHNNGIHTKDDLEVKNLTLTVCCADNALKGNDSVDLKNANITLIATQGDGIKTTNSNVSDKGNQRGTVSVTACQLNIFAACDGIDAAYEVVIDDATTAVNIYTDKYSPYSEEITSVAENVLYIRFTSDAYQYAVQYYNSVDDYTWVTVTSDQSVSGGWETHYYYTFPRLADYEKIKVFIYDSTQQPGQAEDCLMALDYMTLNEDYDTIELSVRGNYLYYGWTNFTTSPNPMGGIGFHPGGGPGGMGGMDGGNPNKSDHSTKGIKAANEIQLLNGTVRVQSYDDALHAGQSASLENGAIALGNVTVSGGTLTVASGDDGLHADGTLTVSGGNVIVTDSYEGLEGKQIRITGGAVSITSDDDGVNAAAQSGEAIVLSGGTLSIYAGGDGLDSNSRTSYYGIVFSGATVTVISTSSGNSAIDTEGGYRYTAGIVLAVMPNGSMMSNGATHCADFASISTTKTASLQKGQLLSVSVDGVTTVSLTMPASLSARVIYLGSTAADIQVDQ